MSYVAVYRKRLGTVLRLSSGFGMSPISFVLRYLWLERMREFSESEIFSLALMDPTLTFKDLKQYQSKERARTVYRYLNASEPRELLDDKNLFHKTCEEKGLASIPVTARLTREDLKSLLQEVTEGDYASYHALLKRVPDRFVVKPSLGFLGGGILFFQKQENSYYLKNLAGEQLSPQVVMKLLTNSISAQTMPLAQGAGPTEVRRSPDNHILLVQPLIKAHESIRELTGRELVQSLRICTAISKDGSPRIYCVALKILTGANLLDNFAKGTTGNMLAYMDEKSGHVVRAIGRTPNSELTRVMRHHVDTGKQLQGFKVPFWHEACQLALQAANTFNGTGSVGWDIGITSDGPLLLEGNGTWEPYAPFYEPLPKIKELRKFSSKSNLTLT